jgi:hypothetical protein
MAALLFSVVPVLISLVVQQTPSLLTAHRVEGIGPHTLLVSVHRWALVLLVGRHHSHACLPCASTLYLTCRALPC